MSKKETIIRLVPRIGLPPRPYKLFPWENVVVKSLDDCPLEHSHFIAEHCRLSPYTIELLLRYAKFYFNQSIEDCATEIGLDYCGYWREPYGESTDWLLSLPPIAKELNKQIYADIESYKASQER